MFLKRDRLELSTSRRYGCRELDERPLKRPCLEGIASSHAFTAYHHQEIIIDETRADRFHVSQDLRSSNGHDTSISGALVGQTKTLTSSTVTQSRNAPLSSHSPTFNSFIDELRTDGDKSLPSSNASNQICFGMLDNIPVQQLRSNVVESNGVGTTIFLGVDSDTVQLRTDASTVVGRLDPRYSKIIKVLQNEPRVEMQAYMVPKLTLIDDTSRSRYGPSKKGRKILSESHGKIFTLSVILYGTMDEFEDIGDFFSQCSEYLQPPLRCDRNVLYRNPQSLSGRDANPPMTKQLQSELSLSEIETLAQMHDPSAVLESKSSFPEAEQPAAVRTTLYSHQKQALYFLLTREQGRQASNCADDIWRRIVDEAGGMAIYLNTKTSELCPYHPGDVRGGILADCMGLGKSLSIISLIATNWFKNIDRPWPTLLVVPSSLLQTWEEELRKHLYPGTLRCLRHHGPNRTDNLDTILSYDIILTSYDIVALEWRQLDKGAKPLYSHNWHRIVLDEAHEIRSGKTQRAKAVCALRGKNRFLVTGTPIQNDWDDLVSLLKFLKVYPDDEVGFPRGFLAFSKANSHIRSLLTSICLRRPKNAIELPGRVDKIHRIEFGTEEAAHYNSVRDMVAAGLGPGAVDSHLGTYSSILTKINSLRQICNLGTQYQGAGYLQRENEAQSVQAQELFDSMLSAGVATCSSCKRDLLQGNLTRESLLGEVEGHEHSQPRLGMCGELICASCSTRFEAVANTNGPRCTHKPSCHFSVVNLNGYAAIKNPPTFQLPAKISALQNDILALPETEKSIIFSFWTTTLDLVGTALKRVGITYTRVDGSMPVKVRQQALASLAEDPQIRVILISLRCGSNGLNLTAANNVFLMEPQWNPMLEDQALDRVHRIGQTKEVMTIRYLVKDSLEESIRYQQSKKRNLAEYAFTLAQRQDDWIELLRGMLTRVPL